MRHDYDVVVRGTLVDGHVNRPLVGLPVTVKVGGQMVYDGYTDDGGNLAFSYQRAHYRKRGGSFVEDSDDSELTVLFHLEVGAFGVVELPVMIGGKEDVLSLGDVHMQPIGG